VAERTQNAGLPKTPSAFRLTVWRHSISKCLSHVYILATTHVLSSILRPTLMTGILLTDASIGP
jgi:hypothetical protein